MPHTLNEALGIFGKELVSTKPERVFESSSHVNDCFKCTPEKKAKLAKLKTRANIAEQNVKNLKARLEKLSEKQGENLDSRLHGDLLGIMNSENESIRQSFPNDSFARLFWEQQLHAASLKDPRQMRWQPLII